MCVYHLCGCEKAKPFKELSLVKDSLLKGQEASFPIVVLPVQSHTTFLKTVHHCV